MRAFVIHRSFDRKAAVKLLAKISSERRISLKPFILNSSHDDGWKLEARAAIEKSEAVIVFDNSACEGSENARWEIRLAKELSKPLIFADRENISKGEIDKLCAIYDLDSEFESNFRTTSRFFLKKTSTDTDRIKDSIELYKIMVESSEQLIQRRQSMNAFFIAAIGALFAFAGALVQFGNDESKLLSFLVVGLLGVTGLALCNSWHNLIENYGKLNTAKFRVISKLEEILPARIFSAEWSALGKGLRPKKYRSFTSTEKKVPLGFAFLISFLLFLSDGWYYRSQANEVTTSDMSMSSYIPPRPPGHAGNKGAPEKEHKSTTAGKTPPDLKSRKASEIGKTSSNPAPLPTVEPRSPTSHEKGHP